MPAKLLGDNLGKHEIWGFVCAFALANFPCRFCRIGKVLMRRAVSVDRALLRTRENYQADVLLDDQSKTGIRHECDFNQVDSFHVTENLEGDILRDFDEGTGNDIMTFVIFSLTGARTGCFKLSYSNR